MTSAPASASRHLIIGNGAIGRATAAELRAHGHAVTLASRTADPSDPTHLRLDALDGAALMRAAAGCSHIYLTLGLAYRAAVWERDWPRIMAGAIAAALAHGALLVWFDNLYAYGPLPLAIPMHEDHTIAPPSRKGRVRAHLLEMLRAAAQTQGLRWLVARSADFYGPDMRLTILYVGAIERQLQGKRALWLGEPDKRHSFTYTPDAARALALLALDEGAWGQTWHLPTASPAPTPRALLTESARLLGAPPQVRSVPPLLLRLAAPWQPLLREVSEMLYQYRQDYVFSSEKFAARYPDFHTTPYEEGLRAMLDSLRLDTGN